MSWWNNTKTDHIEQNKTRKIKWKQNAEGKCWIWNELRKFEGKKYYHHTRNLHKTNAKMTKLKWVVDAQWGWCFSSTSLMSRYMDENVVVFWVLFGFIIAFLCSGNKIGQYISTAGHCNVARKHKLHSTVNHCYDVTHTHKFIMKPIFMFSRCATKWTNVNIEQKERDQKGVKNNPLRYVQKLHISKTSVRICSFEATCPCPCCEKWC